MKKLSPLMTSTLKAIANAGGRAVWCEDARWRAGGQVIDKRGLDGLIKRKLFQDYGSSRYGARTRRLTKAGRDLAQKLEDAGAFPIAAELIKIDQIDVAPQRQMGIIYPINGGDNDEPGTDADQDGGGTALHNPRRRRSRTRSARNG